MSKEISKLKILIPIHLLPDDMSFHKLYFENIFAVLREKTSVEVFWLVYMHKKQKKIKNKFFETIDIHEFDNAGEVIKTINPDIVFAFAGGPQGQIHHALSLAAKSLDIPVVSIIINDHIPEMKRSKYLKSNITRFFADTESKDSEKKIFMGRGKFFLYKTMFLIKTLNFLKISKLEIIRTLIELLQTFSSHTKAYGNFNSKYANTLHLLESESLLKPLLDVGFKEETLLVTGNPIYDKTLKKIQQFRTIKSEKVHVLLMTSPVVEHGIWTRDERDNVVEQVIRKCIESSNEIELTIKIHPYNEDLIEYQKIIKKINADIKIEKDGDVLDFLEKTDVVIVFSSLSTSAYFTVIAKKPIIVCNFYDIQNDKLVDSELAIECKDADSIIPCIKNAISSTIDSKKFDNFVKEELYKLDGDSGERISLALLDLIRNRKFND